MHELKSVSALDSDDHERYRGKHKSGKRRSRYPRSPHSAESSSTSEARPAKHKSSKIKNFPTEQPNQYPEAPTPVQAQQPPPYAAPPPAQAQQPSPYAAPQPAQAQQPSPYGQQVYYTTYPAQQVAVAAYQTQPVAVTTYPAQTVTVAAYPAQPIVGQPQPFVGGIMRSGPDNFCCCHVTCCAFVWLFFDIAFCFISVAWNFGFFARFQREHHPYVDRYKINFLVSGAANAAFVLSVIIAFVGLGLANPILMLIYACRCLFVCLFQITVNIWIIILWSNHPFYYDSQEEWPYRQKVTEVWGILCSISGMIAALWFLYGGFLAARCYTYYKDLKKMKPKT